MILPAPRHTPPVRTDVLLDIARVVVALLGTIGALSSATPEIVRNAGTVAELGTGPTQTPIALFALLPFLVLAPLGVNMHGIDRASGRNAESGENNLEEPAPRISFLDERLGQIIKSDIVHPCTLPRTAQPGAALRAVHRRKLGNTILAEVGDVNVAVAINRYVEWVVELAWPVSLRTPLGEEGSVARELQDAAVS